MTATQLLQSVYSYFGGRKPQNLVEPVVLAKAVDAIKMLTKELVYTGSPMAELLLKERTSASSPAVTLVTSPTKNGFRYADLSAIDHVRLPNNRLKTISHLNATNVRTLMEPVNSWYALEAMPDRHCKSYYKWHGNTLYVNFPTTGADFTNGLVIEHYEYLSITDFPYELIDLLLAKLVPMLMGPQATNEK